MDCCPSEALDQVQKALEAGYSFEDVIVVKSPDGYRWWHWKASSNNHLASQLKRPKCWALLQVFKTGAVGAQAVFNVDYFPTEKLN